MSDKIEEAKEMLDTELDGVLEMADHVIENAGKEPLIKSTEPARPEMPDFAGEAREFSKGLGQAPSGAITTEMDDQEGHIGELKYGDGILLTIAKEQPSLIIQHMQSIIPEDGMSVDSPMFEDVGMTAMLKSNEMAYMVSNIKDYTGDGVIEPEEFLTILSEGSLTQNRDAIAGRGDVEAVTVDPATEAKIAQELEAIGIEPTERLVEGLAIAETILQKMYSAMPINMFNDSAAIPSEPIQFEPNGEMVNLNDPSKVEVSTNSSNIPLDEPVEIKSAPPTGMGMGGQ